MFQSVLKMGILLSMCPRAYFVDSNNLRDGFGEDNWVEIGKIPREDEAGKPAVTSGKKVSRKKKDKGWKKNKILGPGSGKKPKRSGNESKLKIWSFDEDISFGLDDQPSTPVAKVGNGSIKLYVFFQHVSISKVRLVNCKIYNRSVLQE